MKILNSSIFSDINTILVALFILCLTLFNTPVLALVEADWTEYSTGKDYIQIDCNKGADCILITIQYTAVGKVKWNIDDIKLYLDANECRIAVGNQGATKVIDGHIDYNVNSGETQFQRVWEVPSRCPYVAHSRYKNTFGDEIRNDRIDAVESENDVCLVIEFNTQTVTSC